VIDDELVLRVERLRDELHEFESELRKAYTRKEKIVAAVAVRTAAAQLAERWLVEVAGRADIGVAITDEVLADLNVEFQRLLTYSDRPTYHRRDYDAAIRAILRDFRASVIVPLKQNRGTTATAVPKPPTPGPITTAFVGQSFADEDVEVNEPIKKFIEVFGFKVLTGEKPKADTISAKVKERIEEAQLFVGVFTRREKIARRPEWTASSWVIDEKAYALAKNRRLVLLKEFGVKNVGGLQGDYEYLEFRRDQLADLLIRLFETLKTLPK
jgi:hypothetical protein